MLTLRSRHRSFLVKTCLLILVVGGSLSSLRAQTTEDPLAKPSPTLSDEAAIQKLVLRAYDVYAKRDVPALLAFFSPHSPYLPEFKRLIQEDFAANERAKIVGIRVNLVRKVQIQGDQATARFDVEIGAVDKETGKEAEGFGKTDYTFRFARENGDWKVWQFQPTAIELTDEFLAAKTDEERAAIMKTRGEPFTDGLLKNLADGAANLLYKKGNDAEAATILNLVLTASRRTNSLLGTANALVGLGDVYAVQGDYSRAADNYQQVMKLAEGLGVKQAIAAMSVKLGNIHYYQGNLSQAMEYYQRSVKLYEGLGSTQDIAYPLLTLGDVYFAQRNNSQALEYYQRSLKICEQTFDRSGAAFLLNRIAEVYAAQERYSQAVDFYQRSMKLQEELGIKSITALSLNGIGNVRYREGNYAEAAKLSAQATDLAREGNAPDVLWKTLTSLGQAYRALKDIDQAQQAFTGAITVLEKLRGQLVGNEREQQLFFENKTVPYVAMVELLIAQNKLAEAFRYAELAKGRMLLDVLRNGKADITKTMTEEERRHEKQLKATVTALGAQLRQESSLPQVSKARLFGIDFRLQKARLEYEAYETRIYAAHPELKVKRGAGDPITIAEVAPLIRDPRTALLEFVVAPEKTYLFVLTKNAGDVSANGIDIKAYPLAISASDLAGRVQGFRRELANNSLDFKDHSQELYELLLGPARKALEGKTTVCIVPADGLWELPFQALLSKPDKYFLEDHAVLYAPSLSVLREMKLKGARHDSARDLRATSDNATIAKVSAASNNASALLVPSILAMGNPTLGTRLASKVEPSDRNLPGSGLPEAEREVMTLGEIYGIRNSRILTRFAAREETVKADAGRYPILHFATHGVLDDSNPLYSRLLLASSGETDDGLLEAREIMKLDLHADLAVLSACQTARGEIGRGEGLIGMSWAFFIAGASTMVVSQWQVDSASTARLMVDFHRELQNNGRQPQVSKAEALRRAALKLMSDPKYRHPFFWSGFVVVGNGM